MRHGRISIAKMPDACYDICRQVLNMKRWICAILILLLGLTGCSAGKQEQGEEATTMATYQMISQEEAKEMMDEQEVLILDVREEHEYKGGHVPGAKLLVLDSINEETAAAVIPAKDTVTLIYCRSGRRSKIAAQQLADMGYTNLYEFGGIIEWPYEIEY